MRESGSFHTQRNTLFSYVHESDAAEIVERAEAEFDGHERVWVSAPDTSAETPSREIAAELFPDADRSDLEGCAYEALIDGTKAESLFDWVPERELAPTSVTG
ncbi:hypothetical protein [Natrinema halophilum]|uniref:hypothetical protein n=1 Tax=Natrinema halophilum TaxID=1699371 RepID=UPI001C52AAF3|nr:hypothetical protein [Natrinema halophilum]UHQ96059.1 hypothetical protein HYG82_20985 [Natrinema halophilum]